MATAYYVYEHRRRDTGAVFYVGKGSGERLHALCGRNRRWRSVAKSVGYDAAIVFTDQDEELVLLAEMELIARHRGNGVRLTNMTDGGDGMTGYHFDPEVIARRAASQRGQRRPTVSAKLKGRPKSAEHRRNLAAARLGVKASAETRALMSKVRKGKKLPLADCHRCGRRMSVASLARWHGDNCREVG